MLASTFPNVQFIMSAHSPAIVAGCDRGEVSVLRRSETEQPFYVDTLQRDFLGVNTVELYKTVFEIEDADRLYLEYALKATTSTQEKRDAEIEKLTVLAENNPLDGRRLEELLNEDRLIRRAEEKTDERRNLERGNYIRAELEAEIERLRSELARCNVSGGHANE